MYMERQRNLEKPKQFLKRNTNWNSQLPDSKTCFKAAVTKAGWCLFVEGHAHSQWQNRVQKQTHKTRANTWISICKMSISQPKPQPKPHSLSQI